MSKVVYTNIDTMHLLSSGLLQYLQRADDWTGTRIAKEIPITGIDMKFAADTNDSVKRRVLRVRLEHARKCMRKSGSAACGRRFCAPMQRILEHAEKCRQPGCAEGNCAETQRIIEHWKECAGDSCGICGPSKIEVKPSAEGNTFDEVVCILDESSAVEDGSMRDPPIEAPIKLEISEPDASGENAPTEQSTHSECDAGDVTDSWNDFVQMISELASKANQSDKVRLSATHDSDPGSDAKRRQYHFAYSRQMHRSTAMSMTY